MNDLLMQRYLKLSNTQEIPNIAQYAKDWQTLADDAKAAGRLSCADAWQRRGDFYKEQAGGEYIRLIEGSFSELIQVSAEPVLMAWQERKDIGDD